MLTSQIEQNTATKNAITTHRTNLNFKNKKEGGMPDSRLVFTRIVATYVLFVVDCGDLSCSDFNLIPFWCVSCLLRRVRPGCLDSYIRAHRIIFYKVILFIKVTVYRTQAPSLAMNACIYDPCAFYLVPRMPFRCRYYVHHTTSLVRSLRYLPCV